jgi:(p)ppGpp synthase/HD superfamily hydrolase
LILAERFESAMVMAAQLHRRQTRKDKNVPYIAHLMAVASLVLEYGGNEDQAIAALLHDAVEDQGGRPTLALIRDRFGDEVAEMAAGCTESLEHPRPPWRERKQAYITSIASHSAQTRLVSCADKLHNARATLKDFREADEAIWGRFDGGRADTLWYYASLADAFHDAGRAPIIDELRRTVDELVSLSARNK